MSAPDHQGEGLLGPADEEAVLGRVATLVARGLGCSELFDAVGEGLGQVLAANRATLIAFKPGGARIVADWNGAGDRRALGGRLTAAEESAIRSVVTAAGNDGAPLSGAEVPVARPGEGARDLLAPIIVEGDLWGALAAEISPPRAVRAADEGRLRPFAELLAAAIANAERGAGRDKLAEEQQALRELAKLVTGGAPAEELFSAVTAAAGRVLHADIAALGRIERDATVSFISGWSATGEPPPLLTGVPIRGENVTARVLRTGRAARVEDYAGATGELADTARAGGAHSGVGTPIVVQGRTWGVIVVYSTNGRTLTPDTETRLASFTELLGAAISNAGSIAALARLAQEQEALRQVATLVARGAPPEEIFAAVTEQAADLLAADIAALSRFESDEEMTTLATWARFGEPAPVGVRWALEPQNISAEVARTGRPARRDDYDSATGPLADLARDHGVRQGVASPVVVDGRLWGVLALFTARHEPLATDTEARLADFTDLLATAVANAESRAELAASRARIVAASDDARRRIERDLHDGAQQRLVSLALELRAVEAEIPPDQRELSEKLSNVVRGLTDAHDQLQQIARGIHPALLAEGGLEPALKTLSRRSALPVELTVVPHGRLPERVEVGAYYVVSETLTNAAKHSEASVVHVEAQVTGRSLQISVRDNGVGGADLRRGSGLIGLQDRVETLGGEIRLHSPPGEGTEVLVELPIDPP
jgi:signal transduction histidine kinase